MQSSLFMSHPDREPLPRIDAAWLRMDSPDNAMVITAALVFDAPADPVDLMRLAEERLLSHRRFRQRVVEPRLGAPYWELDPHFDFSAHVHRLALPSPGGQAELEVLVSELMSTPLDRTRPLWQLYLVEGVGRGSAIIARLHHCMGDGVALVRFLFRLTDEGVELETPEVGVDEPRPDRLVDRAKLLAAQTTTLGRLLLLPADRESVLRGQLGTRKLAAWSPGVELEVLKRIAKACDAKLNDVMVAALLGGLRKYLLEHGAYEPDLELRALVPVYVRPRETEHDLGNHFGLVYVPLPFGIDDPAERIRQVKQRFDALKADPDAVVSLGVLAAMGVATSELEHIGIDLFTKKASVMITNVPGPPLPIHLAGRRLREMVVWAPVSGHLGLGLTLLSYAGEVRLGVAADALRVPNPGRLARSFPDEVEVLFRCVSRRAA